MGFAYDMVLQYYTLILLNTFSGITPDDFQVVELHDCFSANELITYEALGLCPVGKIHDVTWQKIMTIVATKMT